MSSADQNEPPKHAEKSTMREPQEEFVQDAAVPSHSTSGEAPKPNQNPEKDPDDWATGAEPMTGPQKSYLQTLSREAGEAFDENLTKADASKRIEELQAKTGRGKS